MSINNSTAIQYKRISGNWQRYYNRIRHKRGRDSLTTDDLLDLHQQQQGLCAVSGVPLTCKLENGTINFTNSSIDRIIPGSEYKKENIRLVCRIVNIMKWNMTDDELREWCRRIIENG